MIIDTSLDSLMLPALPTYQNEFGTKRLSGGLTTAECTDGIMVWGRRQRPFPVTETSNTTKVEANCTFEVTTAGIELTIADATFAGCEAKVINASNGAITVKGGVSGLNGSTAAVTIPARAMLFLTFFEGWITSNATYSGNTEVSDFEKRIFLASHPVKSYYKTDDPRNPADVYGGTWEQIKDRVLIAAGDSFPAGSTGGQASITLAEANLPSHSHSFTPKGSVSAHSHGLNNHTHSFAGSSSHSHDVIFSTAPSVNFVYWFDGQNKGVKGNAVTNTAGREHTDATGSIITDSKTVTISGTTGKSSENTTRDTATFIGTAGTTGNTGMGTAINIMNPYRAVYTWKRTA